MKQYVLLLLCYLSLSSCHKFDTPQISFYYWQTNFNIDSTENITLNNCAVKKLYIRYFDVGKKNNESTPYPIAPISLDSSVKKFNVIPVIYIQNKVFTNIDSAGITDLAHHIFTYINYINQPLQIQPKEIQFDCDWTESTANDYFHFLKMFKSYFVVKPITLSATIRLHQIKYPKITGIPPVDKGVLMYYNINEINTGNANSIYSRSTAKKYISHLKYYPLPLDIALPIFAWGQQVRKGKVVALLNKMNIQSFQNDTNFIALNNNRLKAKHSLFKKGNYFIEGDEIKIESISEDNLLEMANDIRNNYHQSIHTLIFYDLDKANFNRYENNFFKKVAHHFR